MGYSEIGSEFWGNDGFYDDKVKRTPIVFTGQMKGFMCGRTALDYIIRDAVVDMGLESVLLPSYCCHTMIEPFLKNGIRIRFYSVKIGEKGFLRELPEPDKNEALYLMPYFGFEDLDVYEKSQIKQWKFCILDNTHSCFIDSVIQYEDLNIKYVFASYRKWANIIGYAAAYKVGSDFRFLPEFVSSKTYLAIKEQACHKKKLYIEENSGNKDEFLHLYKEAERMLDVDYVDHAALEAGIAAYEQFNRVKMKKCRRENAKFLLRELGRLENVGIPFTSIKKDDCPLFVPILLQEDLRNHLRAYLIEKGIFCPIHWPISPVHELGIEEKKIYRQELSIICDQRYDLSDMQKIIDYICGFLKSR